MAKKANSGKKVNSLKYNDMFHKKPETKKRPAAKHFSSGRT